MTNIRSKILLIGAVAFILTIGGTVAAITDETGDVWYYQETDGGWSWDEYSKDKPNLDITEVSHSIEGTEVTLILKVNGVIENSEDITYWIYLEGDDSDYGAQYSNNVGWVGGEGAASGFYHMLDDPISDDTFTATFEIDNPDESFNVYGFTHESSGSEEQWGDYAPNEYAPWYSGNEDTDDTDDGTADGDNESTDNTSNGEDTSGNGTPGFELVLLFLSIVVASIFIIKRRKV
ncbi:MAG: hypothetical protein R6U21_07015 [Thermoplasmatota archaeon]